jgi:O-methyltransferase
VGEVCLSRHLHHTIAALAFRRYSLRLDQINHNAALSHWLRGHKMKEFATRRELHRHVGELLGGPVDYLEFGVYRGESIKMWAELNRHESSRFFGFDSFEGLPEAWGKATRPGDFNVGGELPRTDDPRMSFVKGWFNDTLVPFLETFEPRAPLVIHNDSDLYPSTLYILTKLDPILVKGSVLIFDEFYSALHELRAFQDYTSAYRRQLHPIGRVLDAHGRVAFIFS